MPNLTYINKLSNGDENFKKRLIDVIKFEFPTEKNIYQENIKLKNYQIAAENVHKIKHKISILSFKKGYKLASKHENNLKENNNNFEQEFEEVLKTITSFLSLI
ncbi:MAG: Hpt domain-containing protein [Flavobacteriaceae bacterium]|jgi:HPt (histidine-containing phosphotransfer) domain-containing protein|nr:Hpt domain-containing protein [Flavobacteriaceae bacterium]